jgi:hypothetical protein
LGAPWEPYRRDRIRVLLLQIMENHVYHLHRDENIRPRPHCAAHVAFTHISPNTEAAFQRTRKSEETPHRCLSAPTWAEEEDGVVAGLGDAAGDEVLEFAARPKQMVIEAAYQEGGGGWSVEFGSPVVGVRGRPEGGVDEGGVAEPCPQHGLRLARHGCRRRHGNRSWRIGAVGKWSTRGKNESAAHFGAPVPERAAREGGGLLALLHRTGLHRREPLRGRDGNGLTVGFAEQNAGNVPDMRYPPVVGPC